MGEGWGEVGGGGGARGADQRAPCKLTTGGGMLKFETRGAEVHSAHTPPRKDGSINLFCLIFTPTTKNI